MDKLGLSEDELATYLRTISGPVHERLVEFTITDLDGKNDTTLAPIVTSGQITYNRKNSPTRILEATFVDIDGRLSFDSGTKDNPGHRRSMIEVRDWRLIPDLDRWVPARCFTGVIYKLDRDGAEVHVVAHGKEQLAMGARWKPRSWKRKKRKTDIIKALLRDAGERTLRIPTLKARTPKVLTVRRMDRPWRIAHRLAASMDRQLFYDGRGRARLRRLPRNVCHTFDESWLLSDISVERDPEGVFNVFTVTGRKPKGKKRRRPSATVWLDESNPVSAKSLERNGEEHVLPKRKTNNQLRTRAACRKRARRMRERAARQSLAASAEALALPNLDEGDLVRVSDGTRSFVMRLDEFSLPLTNEGGMSLGDTRRVGTRRGREKGPDGTSGVAILGDDE